MLRHTNLKASIWQLPIVSTAFQWSLNYSEDPTWYQNIAWNTLCMTVRLSFGFGPVLGFNLKRHYDEKLRCLINWKKRKKLTSHWPEAFKNPTIANQSTPLPINSYSKLVTLKMPSGSSPCRHDILPTWDWFPTCLPFKILWLKSLLNPCTCSQPL